MAQQTYGEYMRSNPPIPTLTAVEWLIDYIKNLEKYPYKTIQELEEQAKLIEKEQMKNMWKGGQWSVELGGKFEQYYNETYGK
jgi:hypothetical protein